MTVGTSQTVVQSEERDELIARYARTVWLRAVVWDVAPGMIVLILLIPGTRVFVPGMPTRTSLLIVAASIPYGVGCIWHVRRVIRRLFGVVDDGLAGRMPIDDLRSYVGLLPFAVARRAALYWLGLLVWMPPWIIALSGWKRGLGLALVLVVLICGVEGGLLTYLVIERTLRDLKALVMRGADRPSTRRLRVGGRFLASFAASVVLPLVILDAVLLIGIANDAVASLPPYVFIFNVVIMVVGLVFTAMTARSITAPLESLRNAADHVARGDLDVEVDVDDSGEIGSLQLGFNQMVGGLRDRERVRDLFGRHVGGEVAEMALAAAPNLDGEVRTVTAMFVDFIGSTPLAQSTPPIDVVTKLNAFFEAVVRNVAAEGGTVNQFQGDGAVCVFGAPLDQPDHAARALRCAARLANDLTDLDGIEAAIGISTGEAVAGNIGTLDRYGYTVIGDPVNEASRLCDAAKEALSRVLVAEKTFEAAGSPDGWREAGSFALKGRPEQTDAYTRC